MKRILTLTLALLLALGVLSGCSNTELHRYSEDALDADPGQYAMDAHSPETVVMTIDGTEVHWNEFAFWLCSTAQEFAEAENVPAIADWNAVYDEQSGQTYAEALMETVLEKEKQFHSLEAKAADYGIELGKDGEAYVEQSLQESLDTFDIPSEEEGAEILHKYYLDADVLRYQAKISYLYLALYQEIFGAEGEKLAKKDLVDYVKETGYMKVKHILWSNVDANNQPLDEKELQRKLDRAQRVIDRLNEIEDRDERVAQFERYMRDYNQDMGVTEYPDGYCFTSGEMEEPFEQAAAALAPYEVSPQPVETSHGYHVILRLPTSGDDVIDVTEDGTPYTLCEDASQALYMQMVQAWMDDAEVQWQPDFEHLDVQKLMTKPETFWEKLDFLHWFH